MKKLALAILLAATPASADWFDALGYGVYASRAADIASTEFALQRADVREVNPVLQNRGARIATFAMAPLINLATAKIHRTHPRLALIFRIVVVVAWSSAAAHNTRMGR